MEGYARYALFFLPQGALYDAGSAWLGWDSARGGTVPHPALPDLDAAILTARPRRYGFHATIKPPFRLAADYHASDLDAATRAFCAGQAPVVVPPLELRRMGGFLALAPAAPCPALTGLAAAAVRSLDRFRARPSRPELARRRKAHLSPRQDALLARWGHPHVMEEFRFHLTLTGPVPTDRREAVHTALTRHLAPLLPARMTLDTLCLMGEAEDGHFHVLRCYRLSGRETAEASRRR